jgi:hypothetical protein
LSDEEGLARAYAEVNGTYHDNGTLYVAGTRTLRDWAYNPAIALRQVQWTPRYKTAENVLRWYPHTTRLVGHSLGASVAKELARVNGLEYEIYANPGMTWDTDVHSHRHRLDPISLFDQGATADFVVGNPHAYSDAGHVF